MDNQFRNTVFGGFNRQDVMDYLERSAREHNDTVEKLRSGMEESGKELNELRAQLAQAQQQVQALTRELEQVNAGRQSAQEQTAAQEDRMTALRQENDQLRSQVAQLEPAAAAYDTIKERTAGIELDAHRRAQAIVEEAMAQAEQQRRELGQWLERVERDYYDLRAQVGATATQATSELERVRQGLDNITLCMNNQHSALERLMQTAKNPPSANNE